MNTTEEIYKIITSLEDDQEYLQLGNVNPLIYQLQKIDYENWEQFIIKIKGWTDQQRIILTSALVEIGDNKKSNYDTSKILALSFILAEKNNAKVLMNNLEFLNNGIPKDIELINQIFEKIKLIENKQIYPLFNFEKAYNLINQLYIDGVIIEKK